MNYIKPPSLSKGDTVAVISPSSGFPNEYPHLYELGLEALKSSGLKVNEFPTARMSSEELYNNPKRRAEDINQAFKHSGVDAVIASIGGEGDCIRILPYLDLEVIKENPKLFMAYSDVTVILTYLNQEGLVTFHGPMIMAGFSQWENMPESYKKNFESFLFNPVDSYEYEEYEEYCNGYPDWSDKSNAGETNPFVKTEGWKWLQGDSTVKGRLFGGCIEVLEFMKGTDY